jgi:hypothetical protein
MFRFPVPPAVVPGDAPAPSPRRVFGPDVPVIQVSPQRRQLPVPAWPGGVRREAGVAARGRRGPGAVGLLVLATVAVYALGSFSELIHLALTRHQVCAEHGHLVHAAHDHLAGRPAPPRVPGTQDLLPATPASAGHDHCGIAGHLRQRGLVSPGPAPVLAARPAEGAPATPVAGEHRPIAPLRLAPKGSPPAVA